MTAANIPTATRNADGTVTVTTPAGTIRTAKVAKNFIIVEEGYQDDDPAKGTCYVVSFRGDYDKALREASNLIRRPRQYRKHALVSATVIAL